MSLVFRIMKGVYEKLVSVIINLVIVCMCVCERECVLYFSIIQYQENRENILKGFFFNSYSIEIIRVVIF